MLRFEILPSQEYDDFLTQLLRPLGCSQATLLPRGAAHILCRC
jgi:hypothetical protein